MEGLKFIVSFAVLALLVLAVAVSDARFAGDSANSESDVSDGLTSTLGDVLGESESLEASETTEGTEGEGDSSASVDVDSSSSFNLDFSSDIDIDVEGEGSASVEDEGSATVDVDGLTIQCPEGERTEWEDDSTEIECRNRNGRINFDVESEGGSSIKVHFKYP